MTAASKPDCRAEEIYLRQGARVLEIVWQDDSRSRLPFALLRTRRRCAECSARNRDASAHLAAHDAVAVAGAHPVGVYGGQAAFSDGHQRGILPFAYLRELDAIETAD